MSLRSMTGYGRGESARGGVHAVAELSSVNRKQLEVKIALPRPLAVLESRVVEAVQERLSRGFVTGSITLQSSAAARRRHLRVDAELAAACVRRLREAAAEVGLADDLGAGLLLELPDVVHWGAAEDDSEQSWPVIARALGSALDALEAMRAAEGRALARDLGKRLRRLGALLARVKALAPQVSARYRQVLLGRLSRAGLVAESRDPVIVKEVAVFAERSDISEEITRLVSHLQQAAGLLRAREPVGRTLDFLAQEMFREINTIGSKANDVRITRVVIHYKTELERVREQVQNLE